MLYLIIWSKLLFIDICVFWSCLSGGSRCLVLITVSLALICVLLLVFIILQHNTITAERDLIKSYKNTKKLELETRVNNLTKSCFSLKIFFWLGNLCGPVCYFIYNELKSWSDSRQYCRDHGADLVIINTEEKQVSFERVWIGLSDIENEGNMTWVDNSAVNQEFWLEEEPNNAGGNEDCIELMPSETIKNWNDLPCSENRKGICEKYTVKNFL
uniref:C-type lectin domain-containing protein n=1 Tax=Cyprinus carpio TaxID=7962 RepID=A0A8C1VVN4_CYPCA